MTSGLVCGILKLLQPAPAAQELTAIACCCYKCNTKYNKLYNTTRCCGPYATLFIFTYLQLAPRILGTLCCPFPGLEQIAFTCATFDPHI